MQKQRITSFGEILFDVFPEYKKLGGAPFNFIYHVKKITGEGNFISRIGDDENGKEIINFLKKNDISTDYIQVDSEHPTGTVNVKLGKDKIPEFQISANAAWDYIEQNELTKKLVEQETDILYFGTLSQRNQVSKTALESLFPDNIQSYGKKIKYFCDVNLRHHFYSKEIIEKALRVSDLFKVNSDELKIISQIIFDSELQIEPAVETIMNQFNVSLMCVTMGEYGAFLADKNSSNRDKQPASRLVDTVGAGDAYAAIMCLGYSRNWSVHKINSIALEFASEVCGIEGALPKDDYFYRRYKREFQNG